MKYILSFIIGALLLSCSNNEKDEVSKDLIYADLPQKWSLYKITGALAGSEITGDDLDYQQFYEFNEDYTFVKTKIQNGQTITATGTFEIVESGNKAYVLKFNEDSSLIENCSNEEEEYLYMALDEITLLSSWWNCDGPGLFYEQVAFD
ncbi:hypothetical protein [Christiangramia sp. SM2212]|uniref:Lipocalin-like domain-containing protein n=1 Tax=Christiangramia sediminicola TaxID=3073267 RepID=A0ABU1EMY2_9FLAO|nr:hypothetical protein [Christiangramia sp. SM2212]MDR5589745.1 hypothetical protein [Christiangramia sp. SM2212]